jgi:hypothetical protein
MRINVTFRRVRATTVAVKKRYVLHILCMCSVALVMQHTNTGAVLYCHLWPLRLHNIFPHSYKWHDFWKNVFEYELVVSVFCISFV